MPKPARPSKRYEKMVRRELTRITQAPPPPGPEEYRTLYGDNVQYMGKPIPKRAAEPFTEARIYKETLAALRKIR
jgi:hypothetical protein